MVNLTAAPSASRSNYRRLETQMQELDRELLSWIEQAYMFSERK